MNEWNIQSRAHQCQACARPFGDKEQYHTLLLDHQEDLIRRDICAACWTQEFEGGATDQKGFVSYWKGIYEAPPAAPPEPIQKENAESLLRKLIALNNAKFVPAGFILAVMLERKRLLKVKEELHRDGQRVFVYEQVKSGDLFTITDPALQLTQLEEVQHVVADLLEHGLTAEGQINYPQSPLPQEASASPAGPALAEPPREPEPLLGVPDIQDSPASETEVQDAADVEGVEAPAAGSALDAAAPTKEVKIPPK